MFSINYISPELKRKKPIGVNVSVRGKILPLLFYFSVSCLCFCILTIESDIYTVCVTTIGNAGKAKNIRKYCKTLYKSPFIEVGFFSIAPDCVEPNGQRKIAQQFWAKTVKAQCPFVLKTGLWNL